MDRVARILEEEGVRLGVEVDARTELEEQMKQVLQKYEETISEIVADNAKEREYFDMERGRLQEELDEAVQDLKNVEAAFADFHRKFEKTIMQIEWLKQNEDELKSCLEDSLAELARQEEKYEKLKLSAEGNLARANREIANLRSSQDANVARLTAKLKTTEMKVTSLKRSVDQQVKGNEEVALKFFNRYPPKG